MIENSFQFSFKRLYWLMILDIKRRYIPGLVPVAALFAILIAFRLFIGVIGFKSADYSWILQAILYFGGIWVASSTFSDFHRKPLFHHWFMLPATALEKFLARTLLATVGFSLFIISMFALYVGLATVMLYFMLGHPLNYDYSFLNNLETIYETYSIQSVFLLGSSLFLHKPLAKTVLAIFGFMMVFAIISSLFSFPFNEFIRLIQGYSSDMMASMNKNQERVNQIRAALIYFYHFGLMPLMLFFTYKRLTSITSLKSS